MEPAGTRRWSWFMLGLALPVVSVTSLLIGEPNQSKATTPTDAALTMITVDRPTLGREPGADPTAERAAQGEAAVAVGETAVAEGEAGAAQGEAGAAQGEAGAAQSEAGAAQGEAGAAETAAAEGEAGAEERRAVLTDRTPERLDPAPAETAVALEIPQLGTELRLVVERGDTLEKLFRRNGLDLTDLAAIVALPEAGASLRLLRPGDEIAVRHEQGDVLSLTRELDAIELLAVTREDGGYAETTIRRDADVRTATAHGVIETSLFEAATEAGMADSLTMSMAGIFQWDIDFILDVRRGDEFTVIYEELWRDGEKLRDGAIVAAEFVNRGRPFRAARYELPGGRADYFTPEGRSVRKAFLRAPVSFTRVSSNFNPNRRHPVLNTIRAHRGVDYAAPPGTPVKAAGDGSVESRGRNGGYGNTVVLRHGGNVTTLYAHLSRFGRFGVGNRVKQGDVIGYVGSSGLATGPHLHYEYRLNGVHRNPRTVALPPADPVPAELARDFRAATAGLWRQLDAERDLLVAEATE